MNAQKSKTTNPQERTNSNDEEDSLGKFAGHTKELFEDLTAWVELKIQYVVLDYKEQITNRAKGAAFDLASVSIILLAVLFGLVALALGIGTWLSHPAWGFLVVTGLLLAVALIVHWIGLRASQSSKPEKKVTTFKVPDTQRKLEEHIAPDTSSDRNGKD